MIDLMVDLTEGNVEKGGVETLIEINQLNDDVV